MPRLFKKYTPRFFTAFFLCMNLFLSGQTYNFRTYSVNEGLSQSQAMSLYQDSRGNLWIGTNSGGVNVFDGSKFINYTEKHGLINNVVFSVAEDRSGNILFGTSEGLSVFNRKTFKSFTDSTGLPHNRIYCLMKDKQGLIWIGTKKGLCTWNGKKLDQTAVTDTLLSGISVLSMYEDHEGNLWIGSFSNILYKYRAGKTEQITLPNADSNRVVRTIISDGHSIYAGTLMGINKIDPRGKAELMPDTEVIIPEGIATSCRDKNNTIWFASSSYGLVMLSGGKFTEMREKNSLPSDQVLASLIDQEGNLWLGTNGKGITMLGSRSFYSYGVNEKFPDENITAVFQDKDGAYWAGTQNAGLVKMQGKKSGIYKRDTKNRERSVVDDDIYCIAQDSKDNIWIGTRAGLSVFDGRSFKNYRSGNGLLDEKVYSLLKDKSGSMWVGTREGLMFYDGTNLVPLNEVNAKLEEGYKSIYRMAEDSKGAIWLATERGAVRFDKQTHRVFRKREGFTDKRVLAICTDDKGNLWFGTNEGIFCFNGSAFEHIDEGRGISSNKIYLLLIDDKQNLWAGTNRGLDRIDLKKYNEKNILEIKHYGKEEGFSGLECNANAAIKDNEGKLWFGTIKGLTVFDPKEEKQNLYEPLVRIDGIRLFFQENDLTAYSEGKDSLTGLPVNLTLPYDQNHITFDFIGISFTSPEKVRYQYRLEGADNDWVPVTHKNEATYNALQPGDYTFYLRAMNNDGVWNKLPVTFSFTILPPWYKTLWFYSLCGVVVFVGFYTYTTIRTRNLKRAKILLEQQVHTRTRELREEKEKVEEKNREISGQKAIIETKNRDITDSIKYAKNIQEALLPARENIYRDFRESFIFYHPKDIVSGDFYWYCRNEKKRYIASVDCTGHGVPGAFMSIIGNNLLYEIVNEKNIAKPCDILNELHTGVKNALNQDSMDEERRDGMDIALCSFDEEDNVLEFSGAMRPLWIFRKNGMFESVKADKYPIGGLETENKRSFTNHVIPFEKEDTFYIFSDGYADQFGGPEGKKMMLRNFQKLLMSIFAEPMKEQQLKLEKYFQDWKGNLDQIDDVLVIGFKL